MSLEVFFVGLITGILASGAVALGWYRWIRANLAIGTPRVTGRFGNIEHWGVPISHRPVPVIGKWFDRTPAWDTHGRLWLYRLAGGNPLFTFRVRWQGSPQPITPTLNNANQRVELPDWSKIGTAEKYTVIDGNEELIDLLMKEDGDPLIYGFSNESYFHGLKNPNWSITAAEAYARLEMYWGRSKTVAWFHLRNPSARAVDVSLTRCDPPPFV